MKISFERLENAKFDMDTVKFGLPKVKILLEKSVNYGKLEGEKRGFILKIAICDDEIILRKALRKTIELALSLQGIVYEILEFESGESLLSDLRADNKLDLLFLDIEMKEMNGMDTARTLRKRSDHTIIIFVTSYPDYVFQGYEVRALNYILKPYDEGKIRTVLGQALEELKTLQDSYYLLQQKAESVKIPFQQLLYFQSEGRQILAVTKERSHVFYEKLDTLAGELPVFFVRIHNRYLVNINYISALDATSVLCEGVRLPVSRRYREDVAISFAKKLLR